MRNKQENFIFSKLLTKTYYKNRQPTGSLTWKDYFIEQIIKSGYIPKAIEIEDTITIRCIGAKANIPLEERKKLFEEIKEMDFSEIKLYEKHI